jgi:biotin operon repressor
MTDNALLQSLKTRLIATLAEHHIGAEHGITGRALAAKLESDGRRVRKAIEHCRNDGIAICGLPSTGYYIAESPEDIEATCHFLRARSMTTLMLEARLRQLSLPDLLGQLHLPT